MLMPPSPMPPDKARREKGAGDSSTAPCETGDAVDWLAPGMDDDGEAKLEEEVWANRPEDAASRTRVKQPTSLFKVPPRRLTI
jgi:hypothetical protein